MTVSFRGIRGARAVGPQRRAGAGTKATVSTKIIPRAMIAAPTTMSMDTVNLYRMMKMADDTHGLSQLNLQLSEIRDTYLGLSTELASMTRYAESLEKDVDYLESEVNKSDEELALTRNMLYSVYQDGKQLVEYCPIEAKQPESGWAIVPCGSRPLEGFYDKLERVTEERDSLLRSVVSLEAEVRSAKPHMDAQDDVADRLWARIATLKSAIATPEVYCGIISDVVADEFELAVYRKNEMAQAIRDFLAKILSHGSKAGRSDYGIMVTLDKIEKLRAALNISPCYSCGSMHESWAPCAPVSSNESEK